MLTKDELLEYLTIFGANLRHHRNKLQLSYEGITKQTGISKSILSRIENGQTAPSFETFVRLYKFMSVTTDFFLPDRANKFTNAVVDTGELGNGFKFQRMNFTGRAAVAAEVEEVEAGSTVSLQLRRAFEENILVIKGSCKIVYQNGLEEDYSAGEIFTLPGNRQAYDISSDKGAKIIRVCVPFSQDRSSKNYLTVLGGTKKRKNGWERKSD
ncbi:helix-turn-helix domain-containing protein [Methylobacterium iners]|uniref:HTH cro/C1-type domain-containing protein n=1 Tax=Methylobacterium iners TaxID=418707 RepID=A0ABQ4RWI5_9HYPH|nr:helix-turn-helix transcriptional regulator [Methylobacterium iners]GJD95213.1 hypothetical protein OCOJLMKI_2423 [Methylobacterium iners]